jgi:ATP-dependent DNA helicase RecG
VAHRDCELVDPARITSYFDRIEFVSPGSLPFGVTLEDLRARSVTPRWRNQSLAWFLSRLQLAQAEGQGIQTIRSTMKAVGCPPPHFDATEASVSCVLRAHPRFRVAQATPTRVRPSAKAAPVRRKATMKRPKKSASKKKSKRG